MAAEIRVFPCLSDNFGYLIHDPQSRMTAAIDAPEAGPVIKVLEREGWILTDILVTHHHADHVGGVAELKHKYNCRVVAPHDQNAPIADVDLRVANGDVVRVGDMLARVLETPGHTLDHISYVFDNEKALFAADTLFSVGCGRVFEGTYPMMWQSLLKLRALPDDFRLYCGHEYTASNLRFHLAMRPRPDGNGGGQHRQSFRRQLQPLAALIPRVRLDGEQPALFQGLQRRRQCRAVHGQKVRHRPHGRRFGAVERHQQRKLPIRQPHRLQRHVETPCQGAGGALGVQAQARIAHQKRR